MRQAAAVVHSIAEWTRQRDVVAGYFEDFVLAGFLVLPCSRSRTVEKSLPMRETSPRKRSMSEPRRLEYLGVVYMVVGAASPASTPVSNVDRFFMIFFKNVTSITI